MRPALLALGLALTFAGCLASSAQPATTNSSSTSWDEPATKEIAVRYEGRFALRACTFGSIRHECNGGMLPGLSGKEELHALSFEGSPARLDGTLRILDEPATSVRVDAFLLHREPGAQEWEIDFPTDPYSSGPSPVAIAWDLAPYAGLELAIYVFTSDAVGLGPVGVSVEPPQDFAVDATLTTTV